MSSKQNIMKAMKKVLTHQIKISKFRNYFNKVYCHECILKAQLLVNLYNYHGTFGVRFESCVCKLSDSKIHKEIEQEWVQINLAWEYIFNILLEI